METVKRSGIVRGCEEEEGMKLEHRECLAKATSLHDTVMDDIVIIHVSKPIECTTK